MRVKCWLIPLVTRWNDETNIVSDLSNFAVGASTKMRYGGSRDEEEVGSRKTLKLIEMQQPKP